MHPNRITATPIYANQRIVGVVKCGTFQKRIRGSRHLLRQPPSICLGEQSLAHAEAAGAHTIRVADIETGSTFSLTVEAFRAHAFRIQRGGFEVQLACPLEFWTIANPKARTLPKAPTRQPVQLALTGGPQ